MGEPRKDRLEFGPLRMRQCAESLVLSAYTSSFLQPVQFNPCCAAGAEELVRAAKAAHPSQCKDVGSAALRDLGLDNYN